MFGFSIFMNQPLSNEKKSYIEKMKTIGFTGIFTSLHIPEDDAATYYSRLIELGTEAKKNNLNLMIDISGDALSKAGFSIDRLDELKHIGVTALRMDYHIPNDTIAKCSHHMTVGLNASTITQHDIDDLIKYKANFKHLEAWHNYYPRPETGLDKTWYLEKNQWLKENGFTIQGFVPGDDDLRGPLYEGLPTLEEHRYIHPLASALDLANQLTDYIYIGDGGLSEVTQSQFKEFLQNDTLTLHVNTIDEEFSFLFLGQHHNRQDEARDVVRSANARFKQIPDIPPKKNLPRLKGSVTLDNHAYLRYMGELQITKADLPKDDKVNVVAHVIKKDIPLIDHIKAGMSYELRKDDDNE
ncbi:DUF871 domain-containing protein [Vagococcus luciliae]|uniref:Histidine kinase n=1 Tax=Vagococcus luciliae TaxID=2920380 RepID=A0ABY5NZ27_9ENTE|nr:MupG family TIM beta-alpha barrel fold protein [Vagococcus luciliae]UUV98758.1 hypothetical protein G314FT_09120 [Vagococcus luciliae]